MTGLLNNLVIDRRVFPHQLNLLNDSVLLVQLNDSELREHSFLDQRILRQGIRHEWVPWRQFEVKAAALQKQAPSYIFHIGHCGSTLLSRLISAATGTQALREPLPLRTLALDQADGQAGLLNEDVRHARLQLFEQAWARGPVRTVVKATSICTNLMSSVNPAARQIFVFQQRETHLAAVLAKENALGDLRGFAQNRYRRLQHNGVDLPPLASFTAGKLAALAWLAEAVSAHDGLTQRSVTRLDFDSFLRQPEDGLISLCSDLDMETSADSCRTAVSGSIMRTYSKAPEYEYGPELRNEVIAESRTRNRDEITSGLRWIERLAVSNAVVGTAVDALEPAT